MLVKKEFMVLAIAAGVASVGCGDDPASTSVSDPNTQFEIEATRVETFEEVAVHVQVHQDGSAVHMQHGELEIEHRGDGHGYSWDMESDGDGFTAHMMFFEPGTHQLHFWGTRQGGDHDEDFGHHEVQVHRQHRIIGPYWVELKLDPVPPIVNQAETIRVHVFERLQDGTPGDPVDGLSVRMQVRGPDMMMDMLVVTEEQAGVYMSEHTCDTAGMHYLQVQIGESSTVEQGEFHFPVLASLDDDDFGHHGHGGGNHHDDDGHGHGR